MFTLQILDRGQTSLHPLAGDPLTLGSGAEADVRLGEADVMPLHVRFVPNEGGVRLVAFAPVRVNGVDTTTADLAPGDRIEVGRAELVVLLDSRAAGSEDVIEDIGPRLRRQRLRRKLAAVLVPVVVAAALVVVAMIALRGGVGAELAAIARLRQSGQLEGAAAAIEGLRSDWALATDDRLQRLEEERQALRAVERDVERLTTSILDRDATKGYGYWKQALQKLEGNGSPSEQVAARCVGSVLSELMLRRPRPVITPLPRDLPASPPSQPSTDPEPPPVTAPLSATASPAAAAPSTLNTPAETGSVVQAERLAGQGLFAQAIAVLQAAQADAENAEAAARLRDRIAGLRDRAQLAMQTVIDESKRAISAGKPGEAVSMLTAARHRFPVSPEFGVLALELGKAEALVEAATRKATAQPGVVDETVRMATLESLRRQMESVRTAEERAAFAEVGALLREAAALVRDRDADFAARLASRADEAELLAAWHDSVTAILKTGRTLKTTAPTGQSIELQSAEGPLLLGNSTEGQTRLTWHDIPPAGVNALAEQSAATGTALLGAATLLYRQGDNDRAETWLAKALRADASLKSAIDRVIARGRGEPPDALGYQLGKGGFVSGRSIEVQKQAQKLGARLAGALRDRNSAARDALVVEVRASGPDAVAVMVAAFQKEFGNQIDRLHAGNLKKQVDRLAEQRAMLDRARQYAKDLIYDEVKYFYPYKPPAVSGTKYNEYLEVQTEVDRRVAALRTLWQDQRLRVRVPMSLRADLDRLDWVAKVLGDLGELDQASLARVEWARALPAGDSVGIADYCTSSAERSELEEWRHVEAYNGIIGKQVSSAVRELLKITNDYRAMFRHRPLALVRIVCDAAQGHAEEMSRLGYFSHMSPTPGRSTPYDRMRLAGYKFGVSENIALVGSAPGAHNAWCQSSGHHRNLLDASHREIGIGADGNYWVQNFGSGTVHRDEHAWTESGGTAGR